MTDSTSDEEEDVDGIIRVPRETVIERELELLRTAEGRAKYSRFVANALSSIPWIGGFIAATAAMEAAAAQGEANHLQQEWLHEHKRRLDDLAQNLNEITNRLERVHDDLTERLQSDEYMTLVRRSFRSWDNAETAEKRRLVVNLISNAAATQLTEDDLVRLFIEWVDTYHEAHFAVIREIYRSPGITRGTIWDRISGPRPREDSAEADLYRLLIRQLSMGGVIRQGREVTVDGQFRRRAKQPSRGRSDTMESAFEDTKPYVLTAFGEQFVHYTMNEVTTRVDGDTQMGPR